VAQELDGAAQGGEGLPWQAYGPALHKAGPTGARVPLILQQSPAQT